MATDTMTPKPEAKPAATELDRPTGKVLPGLLLAILLGAAGYGVFELVTFLQSVESTETVETKFVLRRMTESVRLFEPVPVPTWISLPTGIGLGVAAVLVAIALLGASLLRGLPRIEQAVFGALFCLPIVLVVILGAATRAFASSLDTTTLMDGRVKVFYFTANGKAFWLVLLFLIPMIAAAMLSWRYFYRRRPLTVPALVIAGVLCLPAIVAASLAFRAPERAPFLEIEAPFYWTPILAAVVLTAVVYVAWMYVRDGQAVGWLWASFLGTLRVAVYLLLLGVFLLPALQTMEKSEIHSRVLLLLDLSGSMNLIDEITEEGKTAPPTRLEYVHAFLTQRYGEQKGQLTFLERLQEQNPVIVYGFGGKIDEEFKEFKKTGPQWSAADWAAWLKIDLKQWVLDGLSEDGTRLVRNSPVFDPDKPGTPEWAGEWHRTWKFPEQLNPADQEVLTKKRDKLAQKIALRQDILTGTNYGDSTLAALTRESTNMLAGIIVIGDGNSNQGSPSTYEELRRRAANLKVPIFAVGVGEVRELIAIRITDLQAPEQAPPDEAFPVQVEVDGEGLTDKDFPVTLDIYKPGEPKTPAHQITTTGKFKQGAVPHGSVTFKIDPADPQFAALVVSGQSGKPELIEGAWKFIARVPKAKGETFAGKEHVSDAAEVQVIKKPLRVLLFAGGPTREYQFTRRLFVNETDKKRAELSVFLQVTDPKGPRVQDVPQERLLKSFPNILRVDDDPTEKIEDKYYNLAVYDLIIAFDPDWTQVPREQLDLLQKWVEVQAGGLVIVGGPIHTFQLARGSNLEKLKPVIDLAPVRVEDSRLAGLGVERTTNKPWRLNFPGITAETEFLKLDEEKKEQLAGWEEFFTGRATGSGPPPVGEVPQRGFFSYYPVKTVKPTATVIATFTDPQARLIKEDNSAEEQPYIVTMPFGKGRVLWVGSGELWRLRLFKEVFHERLWTKMGRYAAAGTQTKQTKRGSININPRYPVGSYARFTSRLYGKDLNFLPPTAQPEMRVNLPAGVPGKPLTVKLAPKREGEWAGDFEGQFQITAPGEYKLELPVPGSNEIITRTIIGKETNLELDRSRPNFSLLRNELASTVAHLRLDEKKKNDLKQKLQTGGRPGPADKVAPHPEGRDEPPLFFDLQTAKSIPEYLSHDSKTQRSRGPIEDLWPAGPEMNVLWLLRGKVGTILFIVVGLLSVEWLTRKLLRLA